jgi:GGDEF domain-containing protein
MSDFCLGDLLEIVVSEALALTGAEAAVVELPADGQPVVRAAGGTAVAAEADETRVPLVHGGRTVGVLKLYASRPRAVEAVDERALRSLGLVVGAVVAHPHLLGPAAEHARVDALTGLANRRSWDDQLERALAHAGRTNETVSVGVCHVGGGGALLRTVADMWRAHARAADLLARIGRAELALLLPGADELAAADVLRRLADALPVGSSVAYGIAEWDLREDGAELTARAAARITSASPAAR